MRGAGNVYRPTSGKGETSLVWWVDFSLGGTRVRRSTGTRDEAEAREILRQYIAAAKMVMGVG